jgi:hypothetical protein
MYVAKIGLAFVVANTLIAVSVWPSLAQDDALKITSLRAGAISTCSTATAKFPDYSWGNTEIFIYRACMNGHRQQE